MTTTIAAMKGKLGSTEYFIATMKAQELVEKTRILRKTDWENLKLEEREQRDINYARVKNDIAPYLASNKNRFFGAIIVAAKNFDADRAFEHLPDIVIDGLPNRYKAEAKIMKEVKSMGFLTFSGGEVFIPLDGQHRMLAIRFAIQGMDQNGKLIDITPCADLANEDVTVIIVPYDRKKSREIFTKVNRYAKSASAGQSLVTDDNDIVAVLSRLVANDIIGADLVDPKSNNLTDKSSQFTTLTTIERCNVAILEAKFGKIERKNLPDPNKGKLYEKEIRRVWEFLVKEIKLFASSLKEKGENGDNKRIEIRADYLLGKPVLQACVVEAFTRLTMPPANLTFRQAADKLNAVDWRKNAPHWDRLLMSGGKIITSTKHRNLATDILYSCAGGKLDQQQQQELLGRFQSLFPEDEQSNINQLPKLIK